MKPTKEHADKIKELLTFGLTKGVGIPEPGKMCVEAAVCFALGLPHSDNPPCVGKEVRNFKITLNDQNWSSNQVRAEGMKRFAIAQLGSDELNQIEFLENLYEQILLDIIIPSFDLILQEKRIPEHDELKQFLIDNFKDKEKICNKFKSYNYKYYNHYNNYNNHYRYYYYYYYYSYKDYNHYFGQENFQKMLTTMAECGVKVLQKMNCLGCQWLDM